MNDQVQHTPGPWRVSGRYGPLKDEVSASGRAVASVWTRRLPLKMEKGAPEAEPDHEGEANARLIAASPVLLDALRGIHAALTPMTGGVKIDRAGVARICAEAIALAEGQS